MFHLFSLSPALRSFSTSAAVSFPKLKTHNGAKKRWRAIANGKFKRAHANHSHKNVSKRPARKNNLAQTTYSSQSQTVTLKRLLPYA